MPFVFPDCPTFEVSGTLKCILEIYLDPLKFCMLDDEFFSNLFARTSKSLESMCLRNTARPWLNGCANVSAPANLLATAYALLLEGACERHLASKERGSRWAWERAVMGGVDLSQPDRP